MIGTANGGRSLESGNVISAKTIYRRRNTMTQGYSTVKRGKIIQIDEEQVKDHLGEIIRGTVQETLNPLLNEEADKTQQSEAILNR